MSLNKPIRRIAVIGTGAIGSSWAALYLARGLDVIAVDPARHAESNLRRYVDTAWHALSELGLSPKASPQHLDFTPDLTRAVADADFVQESGPELEELKIRLFADMDAAAPPDSIIASSSSGLTMSVLQSACKHPERCILGHPFNPPHLIPLVEVVGGANTSPEAIQQAVSFYTSIGRKPIQLRKEVAGHAANRLQAALYREMAFLIEQGVLSVADADAAVCWGPGLQWGVMGPNLLLHLAGGQGGIRHFMEYFAGPLDTWWNKLGNGKFTAQFQQTVVDGILQEVGNRSVEQLTRERDQMLLGLVRLRTSPAKASASSKKAARTSQNARLHSRPRTR
jgi:3-hydroxyacyl-CoA dehydrogenase